MDSTDALNNQLRQEAHADEVRKAREERQLTPEQRAQKQFDANVRKEVEELMKPPKPPAVTVSGNASVASGDNLNIHVKPSSVQPDNSNPFSMLPPIPDATKDYVLVYDHSTTAIKWAEVAPC